VNLRLGDFTLFTLLRSHTLNVCLICCTLRSLRCYTYVTRLPLQRVVLVTLVTVPPPRLLRLHSALYARALLTYVALRYVCCYVTFVYTLLPPHACCAFTHAPAPRCCCLPYVHLPLRCTLFTTRCTPRPRFAYVTLLLPLLPCWLDLHGFCYRLPVTTLLRACGLPLPYHRTFTHCYVVRTVTRVLPGLRTCRFTFRFFTFYTLRCTRLRSYVVLHVLWFTFTGCYRSYLSHVRTVTFRLRYGLRFYTRSHVFIAVNLHTRILHAWLRTRRAHYGYVLDFCWFTFTTTRSAHVAVLRTRLFPLPVTCLHTRLRVTRLFTVVLLRYTRCYVYVTFVPATFADYRALPPHTFTHTADFAPRVPVTHTG